MYNIISWTFLTANEVKYSVWKLFKILIKSPSSQSKVEQYGGNVNEKNIILSCFPAWASMESQSGGNLLAENALKCQPKRTSGMRFSASFHDFETLITVSAARQVGGRFAPTPLGIDCFRSSALLDFLAKRQGTPAFYFTMCGGHACTCYTY